MNTERVKKKIIGSYTSGRKLSKRRSTVLRFTLTLLSQQSVLKIYLLSQNIFQKNSVLRSLHQFSPIGVVPVQPTHHKSIKSLLRGLTIIRCTEASSKSSLQRECCVAWISSNCWSSPPTK